MAVLWGWRFGGAPNPFILTLSSGGQAAGFHSYHACQAVRFKTVAELGEEDWNSAKVKTLQTPCSYHGSDIF